MSAGLAPARLLCGAALCLLLLAARQTVSRAALRLCGALP